MFTGQPAIEQGFSPGRVFNKAAALGGMLFTFMGPGTALAGRAHESSRAVPKTIGHLYTSANPGDVMHSMQADLLPGESINADAIVLSASTIDAQGSCDQGTTIRTIHSGPDKIEKVMCDGQQETDPSTTGSSTQTPYQKELNLIGGHIVSSIPGHSMDVKDKSISVSKSGINATFFCPKPSTLRAATSPKKITVSPNNSASWSYCDAQNISTVENPVNLQAPRYKRALSRFLSDNNNFKKWAGDTSVVDVFNTCPDQPNKFPANPSFKYSGQTAKASFYPEYYESYCYLVGQNTEQVSVQAKSKNSSTYKEVGKQVVHINGLKNVLYGDYSGGESAPNQRQVVTIAGLGNVCRKYAGAELRIKVADKFTPFRGQTYQHAGSATGSSTGMRAGHHVYYSSSKAVC